MNGGVTIAATWQEIGLPEQNVDVVLDLRARPDLGDSLLYALVITALCGLLSLVLLRCLNAWFVELPDPGNFYRLTTPVAIEMTSPGNWTWGDRSLHRRLGPLLRPFKPPYVRISGADIVVADPSGARPGTTPIGFHRLTMLHALDPDTIDVTTGRIDAVATVLVPKSSALQSLDAISLDIENLCAQLASRLGAGSTTASVPAVSAPSPMGPPALFGSPGPRLPPPPAAGRPVIAPPPPSSSDGPPPFL